MKKLHFLGIVLFIIFVGCATYKIGNETFYSASEALQKQGENLERTLREITPLEKSVHGTVLVLIPSDVEIQKNHIRWGSNVSRLEKEQVHFLITAIKNYFQFIANAIHKREIFDSVSVERHNGNPASFPIGNYDYMVFVDVDGWFISGRDNPKGLPISFDKNKPVGAPRTLAFLDLLYQQAKVIHSK